MANRQILYRKLSKADRQAYWYPGDLPTDRPTAGERISKQEWISLVESYIETRPDGVRVLNAASVFGDEVIVGSADWFRFVYRLALSLRRPLFWEPRDLVRRKKTLCRELNDADKESYWYVELPDDRPTFGKRISAEKWISLVDSFTEIGADGIKILSAPLLSDNERVIVVGSPEWFEWLRSYAMRLKKRLFWEPPNSVGLTEEGARRYGYEESDAVRRVRLEKQAANRKAKRAAKQAAQHAPEQSINPSVFD